MKEQFVLKMDILRANHHHLSAIMNRAEQAKKEAAQKKSDSQQGA